MTKSKNLALITANDLKLSQTLSLSEKQLKVLLKPTPPQYVHTRPAKGGGKWEYVTGGYVKKVLNLMFGWDWDFEITEQQVIHGEAIVQGRLTCRSNGATIVKMQFGNKDVIYRKQSDADRNAGLERVPLSIGNDLKAAATDALKKCAAELGIAADIYNKMDFVPTEMIVTDEVDLKDLELLRDSLEEQIPANLLQDIDRVIVDKEVDSYAKVYQLLMKFSKK